MRPEGSFLRNRLTWVGFAIPALIFGFNGLHQWYPSVPEFPTEVDLNAVFPQPPWNGMGAAGGLYSTVGDLYRWDQALYAEKLLSKKSLSEMFTPYKGNYGYGWYIAEQDGHRFINHSGWIDGFAASFGRYPDDRLTVIVLSNIDSAPVNTIARNIGAIALGLRHEAPEERRAVEIDTKIYDAYVGRYELTPDFIITITREGNRLMGQAAGRPRVELFPAAEDEFFVKEFDAKIKFIKGDRGRVRHAVVSLNGRDTQARKI